MCVSSIFQDTVRDPAKCLYDVFLWLEDDRILEGTMVDQLIYVPYVVLILLDIDEVDLNWCFFVRISGLTHLPRNATYFIFTSRS